MSNNKPDCFVLCDCDLEPEHCNGVACLDENSECPWQYENAVVGESGEDGCESCSVLRAQLSQMQAEIDEYRDGVHPEQVMYKEELCSKCHQGIEFADAFGNFYKIYYEEGDRSVGIFPGWQCDEEFFTQKMMNNVIQEATVELQQQLVQTQARLDVAERVCRAAESVRVDLLGNADSRSIGGRYTMIETRRIEQLVRAVDEWKGRKNEQ